MHVDLIKDTHPFFPANNSSTDCILKLLQKLERSHMQTVRNATVPETKCMLSRYLVLTSF